MSPFHFGRVRKGLPYVAALILSFGTAKADTTRDDLMTDSEWYVPSANLLAYLSSTSSLANPVPVADQTLWDIGDCIDGVFTGSSTATFKLGSIESTSNTSMNGIITPSGQLRIEFVQEDAPTTIGIGQVREIEGTTYIEMQMITGGGSAPYLTHWAYMAEYDGQELPPLVIDDQLRSPEWRWMAGTEWSLNAPPSLGLGDTASFHVDDYRNGYFWGTGTSEEGDFTLLGSATPEGNILFNFLQGGTLTSLTGQITGDAETGTMALRSYESGNLGDLAIAQVVPEPGSLALLGTAALVGIVFSFKSRRFLKTGG